MCNVESVHFERVTRKTLKDKEGAPKLKGAPRPLCCPPLGALNEKAMRA